VFRLRFLHFSGLASPGFSTSANRPIDFEGTSSTWTTDCVSAFQVPGEVDLSDPDPNPVQVFLFYDHPGIPDRVQFCLTYDPGRTANKANS